MSNDRSNGRLGFTGHQGLTQKTEQAVSDKIRLYLDKRHPCVGLCSLAEGADQIFAELLLASKAKLIVVIPCRGYDATFTDEASLSRYRLLLSRCEEAIELDFPSPSEEAFWAAGRRVVEESDDLIAVWDGEKPKGQGGTADVVAYAKGLHKYVEIIWPQGSARK